MKTLLAFETDTPSDLRAQSMAVAAMGPAIEAFEKAMGELGHKGTMTVRHVRAPRTREATEVTGVTGAPATSSVVTPILPGAGVVGRAAG